MSDLTEFLLARIAEDKGRADAFEQRDPVPFQWSIVETLGFPPKRVRAECEAKRWIVEDLRDELANQHDPEPTTLQLAERTLLTLALPYADHPDYREEWRP